MQSSWQKFDFGASVLQMDFWNDRMVLLFQYAGRMVLGIVDFIMGAAADLDKSDILLDFSVQYDAVTVSYDSVNDRSSVTMPFPVASDAGWSDYLAVAYPDNTGVLPKCQRYTADSAVGSVLYFDGVDLTANQFIVGKQFEFYWKLNPIYYRDQNQVAIQDGSLQLRGISLLFSDSGNFEVHVTPQFRDTYVQKHTGAVVGASGNLIGEFSLSSGEMRISAYGKSDDVVIEVLATTPWRVRFTSLEWDGAARPYRKRT